MNALIASIDCPDEVVGGIDFNRSEVAELTCGITRFSKCRKPQWCLAIKIKDMNGAEFWFPGAEEASVCGRDWAKVRLHAAWSKRWWFDVGPVRPEALDTFLKWFGNYNVTIWQQRSIGGVVHLAFSLARKDGVHAPRI
jgi:hypothetical protein